MSAVPIKAFFSCSFAEADKAVNEVFKAICEGFGFECKNVDSADLAVPADVARSLINASSAFIAVIVKRDQLRNSEKFEMPAAVANEISMAYGQGKKILMFAEDCVEVSGMKENFGTCLRFNRLQLSTGAFLKRAVESVDKLRQSLAAGQGLVPDHPTEFYALKAAHSYTLDDFGNGLEWRHSMRRKIRFTKAMQRPLKISRWNDSAEGKSSVGLPPIGVTFNVNRSSKEFTHALKIVDKSAFHVEGDVTFDPVPMEGDEIEYTVVYRGAHLMPIYSDEVSDCKPVQISGQVFKAFDGVIPITPIEVLELEFRFAAAAVGRVQPVFFVGSYSKFIDYLVDSEISRASVRKDEIGENVVIRATVNSALLRHVYGVAWDPPARPESPPVPANSPASG